MKMFDGVEEALICVEATQFVRAIKKVVISRLCHNVGNSSLLEIGTLCHELLGLLLL